MHLNCHAAYPRLEVSCFCKKSSSETLTAKMPGTGYYINLSYTAICHSCTEFFV